MAVELFGFSIGKVDKDAKNKKSFALPEPEDGALEVVPLVEHMEHMLI